MVITGLVGSYPNGPLRVLSGTVPESSPATELRRMLALSDGMPADVLSKLAAAQAEAIAEARRRFGPVRASWLWCCC